MEYEVIVGNIGRVHSGKNKRKAEAVFRYYVKESDSMIGRAGGENVTLFAGCEPVKEHEGKNNGGFFVLEVHHSDGNDNSITDYIVEAQNPEEASDLLWEHLKAENPNSEEDFSDPPCLWLEHDECECEDCCECNQESLTMYNSEVSYRTISEAEKACSTWHSRGELLKD